MYLNPLEIKNKATASSSKLSAVDNSVELAGSCPKCKQTFGIGSTPIGQVYYCNGCRVAMPIIEE